MLTIHLSEEDYARPVTDLKSFLVEDDLLLKAFQSSKLLFLLDLSFYPVAVVQQVL